MKKYKWKTAENKYSGVFTNMDGSKYEPPNKEYRIGGVVNDISYEMQAIADEFGIEVELTFNTKRNE